MRGHLINGLGSIKLAERRTFRLRATSTAAWKYIGFADLTDPDPFNATSLPFSNFDRASVRYQKQDIMPCLRNLSVTAHFQRTE